MSVNNVTSYGDSAGAMLALGNQRQEKEDNRVEAIRMGKGVQNPEQLEKKVRQVAEDFVSVFMNQVMKSMRSTVQENTAMHGDNGEKFFQEMLDTEQSKTLAKGSGYGLTELVYESMITSYRMAGASAETQRAAEQAQAQTAPLEIPEESTDDLVVHEIE
mgnify:CR=1 FL=1